MKHISITLPKALFIPVRVALAFAVVVLASHWPLPAGAEVITPSDVYRVVDAINADLALFHDASGLTAAEIENQHGLIPRRPRHVLQKAREVMVKVQLLRKINGLPNTEMPIMPARDIRPSDVLRLVERIHEDLAELRPIFGVSGPPETIEKPRGKTASDVYHSLHHVSAQLDQLGIPRVVPNDVYRVALTVLHSLEEIGFSRGLPALPSRRHSAADKHPADAYAMGMMLFSALRKLTVENPELSIPGGIEILEAYDGQIEPAHVMDLLNNILADIAAIKERAGIDGPIEFAPQQAGKTPTHVYGALVSALDIVEAMT